MITPVGSGKRFRPIRAVAVRHPLAYAIASVLAMAAMPTLAGGTQALSSAWLAQQAANRPATQTGNGSSSALAGVAAQTPQQLLQQQQVQQSLANLTRAAQSVAAQIAAQQSAQQAAQQQTSPVPNGLTPGGLAVASGVSSNPSLWQNANLPTQTSSNGQTTVQVKQTASKAILTWNSFNVGRNTTLYFNQSGGNQTNGSANNWIALNRVVDPSGVPSQIFGQIKAEGTVYILNHNGVLFGAGSQVNTQSLLASSLDLFSNNIATSNSQFLNGGISAANNGTVPFLVDGLFTDGRQHDVVVQQGASITGGAQGFVLLAAPNVSNAGSVVDDNGQAILAAGYQFANLTASSNGGALTVLNQMPTGVSSSAIPGTNTATNTGLIQSRRGQVEMLGYNVDQEGVALASTSISYPGSIVLNARDEGGGANAGSVTYLRSGALVLGPNSVTTVLPEKDGTTTTSSAAATAAFTPSSVSLSGDTVTFQSGSLLEAPNANLSVLGEIENNKDANPAAGRIYIDNGAVIDVSGLADVELPMSALLVTISRIGQNELANSPLLRNSFLYTQKNVVVDSTQSGITADGLSWVGSPILNVSGYVQDVPRDVTQLMTSGGSINLNGYEVIVRSGAQLNLDGGYLAYQAGWITTPNLLGANGRVYNIANADPNVAYVGFAGNYDVVDNRWGVTTNYSNPLLAGAARWDSGFAVGGNAGTLSIETLNALALDGQITAQAFPGRNQVADGTQPNGGTLNVTVTSGNNVIAPGRQNNDLPGILLQQSAASVDQLDAQFQAGTSWQTVLTADDPTGNNPYDLSHWLPLSANLVQQGGFSALNVSTNASGGLQVISGGSSIQEQPGTTLSVLPGGSINLTGDGITVLGELSAPAGSITLKSIGPVVSSSAPDGVLPGNIVVGNDAVLSARGLWVNDAGLSADNAVGDRYIDGGNINLVTYQYDFADNSASSPTYVDATGSILLKSGSMLDVSGGGYVNSNGELQLSNGIPDGSGGNISLTTYVPSHSISDFGVQYPAPSVLNASVVLDGSMRAYGFSGGGTFSLQAPDLQIGGSAANLAMSNGTYLSPAFFAGQGFDNYSLTSMTDAIIAPGTTVQITRDNLLPNYQALLSAPTGTDIYGISPVTGSTYVGIGQLAPYLRYVDRNASGAGFALNAGTYLTWYSVPQNAQAGPPSYAGVTGSVILGQGASILADAGATVQLAGNASTIVDGTIDAPGGTIDLLTSQQQLPGLSSSTQLWLGSQAVLNVAGVSLINPLAAAVPGSSVGLGLDSRFTPRTGEVLDGGTVMLAANGGYVLTEQGSLIDVSGAADTYDLPTSGTSGTSASYVSTPVWSNGGSILFAAGAGLYADGSLQGAAGAAQGEGGSLQIVSLAHDANDTWRPSATAIELQQSGLLIPSGLAPGGVVEPAGVSGVLHFALDRLNGSGITSLAIGPNTSGTTDNLVTNIVPVGMRGSIDLALGRSFTLYAPSIVALPANTTAWTGNTPTGYVQSNATVSIAAPYVEITGSNPNNTPKAVAGNGVLNISADFMDIGGGLDLQGWSSANFASSGDIRFYVPANLQYNSSTGAMVPGLLFSTGNLSFQAAQLYPVSNYAFVIDANPSGLSDPQGNALSTALTILGNGAGSAPLSAGGGLLLDADRIEQDGTVRVPSGELFIGVQDPSSTASAFGLSNAGAYPLVTTQSVNLGAGSITSVSLDGETVPYGSTVDGQQWSYNGAPNTSSPTLSAPPAKTISIAGNNVSLGQGATIDVSGGGELQASEWVPGTGGTVNVLTQNETSYANSVTGQQVPQYSDGRAIYAIIPGYSAPVSAQDAELEKGAGAGPAVGQSVYLSGVPGLPAGYYTLLPAGYATLPGAYRVVQNTGSQDSVLSQNAVLPDGTMSVTGYFADALDGARTARTTTFLVQSASVWQQYSQYQFTNADTYFAKQASNAGTLAPALPADAGHLILSATQQLQLGTTLQGAPASGGRASLVDIAAQAIQVTSPDSAPLANYLQISADSLSALNAGSLMLGGTRQLTGSGYQVNSVADSVVLSNDSAHPLQGPDILLVANGNGDAGAQGIVLQSGSALLASGSGLADSTPLIFGSNAGTASNGASVPAVSGNGALLRVSQDGMVGVTRNDITNGTASGSLTIAAGATVQGGSALIMDTTGTTSVSPSAVFNAQNIQANASQISFIGDDSGNAHAGGLVIGPGTLNLLSGAQQVTLDSRGAIDFFGNISIDLPQKLDLNANAFVSDGGQVNIKASTLGLGNAIGSSAASPVAGVGQLNLSAGELDFTTGKSVVQGFGSVTATANQGITTQGNGGFDFGSANISFNTPVLQVESGSNTTLITTGAFTVKGATGTPLQSNAIGGVLALTGGSLSIGTTIEAAAGNLNLEATSGDLILAGGATLNTAGINKTFYDVTTYAPGGDMKLVSDQGSVIVQQGATLDFAGAPLGGGAGGVTILAANQAQLSGSFQGQALSGYKGGYFTLSSGGALDLDQLAQLTNQAGTTGGIAISSGAGNLVLSAGQSLTAQDVYLVAGGGVGAVTPNAGVVEVDGTVNVSGTAAGEIQLYGRNGVTVNGSLLASSSTPEQRGGIVMIGTTGTPDGTLNTAYGYENVQSGSAGIIQFGPNASINVSGGTADAGGSVSLRAPLLANGDVPIAFSGGTLAVTGASSVTIEPYAVWSTADTANKTADPAKYFDGLIDPAGWYQYGSNGTSQMVAGTWKTEAGIDLPPPTDAATLKQYLSQDYFTPDAANAAHQSFYGYVNGDPSQGPGTLMGYVEQPGYTFGNRFAGIANVQIRPGIDLINPDPNTNGGDISVLTNWNLGAGTTDSSGTIHLAYRYGATSASASGEAPILTVQALHDLNIDASVTDGFYQQNAGPSIAAPVVEGSPGYAAALAAYQASNTYLTTQAFFVGATGPDWLWQPNPNFGGSNQFYYNGGTQFDITQDPYYEAITAPLPNQSAAYYQNYTMYINEVGAGGNGTWSLAYNWGDYWTFYNYSPTPAGVAPQPAAFTSYTSYVNAYQNWLTANFGDATGNTSTTPSPLLLPLAAGATSNYANYSSEYSTYITGYNNYFTYVSTQDGNVYNGGSQLFYAPYTPAASNASSAPQTIPNVADNSPSNMPTLGSVASLASATLLGGSSSSYRLVAGANFSAVDPLSVATGTNAGNVTLDGHFGVQYTATGGDGKTLNFPTTVRTGTGSIDIASAGDIDWLDQTDPAVIYTAGAPATGTAAGTGVSIASATSKIPMTPDLLVNGLVNPDHGGDILLSAQGNINAIEQVIDTSGNVTGTAGTDISQFWWPWMETGNAADGSRSSVNFANFDQGLMSVGGNVAVNAGGDISNLSVSLPTTWYVNAGGNSITTVGGGNLSVHADGDILSGTYFVAKGQGELTAGGLIGSDITYTAPTSVNTLGGLTSSVATLLGLQDAQFNVQARDGVNIGGIYDPSYAVYSTNLQALIPAGHADGQSYSATSSANLSTTTGDLTLDSLSMPSLLFSYGAAAQEGTGGYNAGAVLPATLGLTALDGNVNVSGEGGLYPSATGNLSILSNGSVDFYALLGGAGQNASGGVTIAPGFGLIDASDSMLPSPLLPLGGDVSSFNTLFGQGYLANGASGSAIESDLHQVTPLHASDAIPVRIYALSGDIVDGTPAPNGVLANQLIIQPSKSAFLYAGRDIVDLSFIGQQVHQSDITRIVAGRDIYDTPYYTGALTIFPPLNTYYDLVPSIVLGGVGNLVVEAGRNVGPLTSQADIQSVNGSATTLTGIDTVGNLINPYLPHDGANVSVLFGVGPGVAADNFLSQYILGNPNGIDGFGSLVPDLVSFMQQWEAGKVVDTGFAQDQSSISLTPQQAEAAFQQLPSYAQQLFAQQEFFKLLAQVDADYNNPASPYYQQYARGYAAIESLFPAAYGYTNNGAGKGGINGEAQTIDTGDLDIRSSTIQTQQGGNISILGPGGQALVGSVDSPPVITNNQGQVIAGPNSMGVLTLEQGNIDMFTDRSVLLAQSRIFTEQGGDMVIWSSNGDINAGQGAKTVAEVPPPTYLCDLDAFCLIDARGEVSGAGIATLQTIPGASRGSVYLVAPRGTVDAGDAGIRVSGNLVVAAAQVLNADNIQVQGQKIGVPVAQTVNVGALTTAGAAAGAVSKVAQDMAKQQQNDALGKQPSIISVQVLGFGDSSTSIQGGGNGYNPNSPVQILGAGPLSDARKKSLTEAERRQLSE